MRTMLTLLRHVSHCWLEIHFDGLEHETHQWSIIHKRAFDIQDNADVRRESFIVRTTDNERIERAQRWKNGQTNTIASDIQLT